MSQNVPKRSLRDFLSLRHRNHLEIFSGILTVYFLNIRASYQSASSGFRLLGPAGAIKSILSLGKAREILSAESSHDYAHLFHSFIFAGFRAVDARRSCGRLTETFFFSFLLSC